ncbi:DsrE family protein [Stutzerimonas nitrititolerans]|uniref:DsrE/DsrF/TusD sulfur relay family protein n=1 Tax=Stutzerimonas nitrititolerans TaxID=2482751 RepID=UPI002896AED9|nr:DsrE family protein [Stutzerimonas nitrititolerans]
MHILFIVNDAPYGTERMFNALRMAGTLVRAESNRVTVFLMGDAVSGAKAGQKTPDGYYNIERMLRRVITGKGAVLLCGTCLDARGINDAEMLAGSRRSTLEELCEATTVADKVLVF